MDVQERIKGLPHSPGVYIMKDGRGAVIYVGKADDLKKRVSSYFQPARRLPSRAAKMVSCVNDIATINTQTSAEALIYENSLIKQYQPRYNVALRDDKTYPMLKLTVGEKFPRLLVTRQRKDDGSVYYGPYTNAKLLREAVKGLRRIFPLRKCETMKGKVCLNYHIKQCAAPCEEKIGSAAYREIVSEVRLFLEGRKSELIQALSEKMAKASRDERFEEAVRYRDRIEALGALAKNKIRYNPLDSLDELKEMLALPGRPERIEAFDISNIGQEDAVGSMVVFLKGRPYKGGYKRFKIKEVSGVDDYAMMREVVRRRYLRVRNEHLPRPDLVLIDGGKAHLGAAQDELAKLGLRLPMAGIAKELELVYLQDRNEPVMLPKESKALHLLERVRDEAHRFAIAYHHLLRSKRIPKATRAYGKKK